MTLSTDVKRSEPLEIKLFGESIQHSRAPLLLNYVFSKLGFNWRYGLLDSSDIPEFERFLYSESCAGAAVTMPNKVRMFDKVNTVDESARVVGAINTIYLRNDNDGNKLYIGTNTDTIGIRDSFLLNAKGIVATSKKLAKPGLVYGGGGACRSAIYALHEYFHCSTIYVVNRFALEVEAVRESMVLAGFQGKIVHIESPELAQAVESPLLIVSTVPDFAPITEEELLARKTIQVFLESKTKGTILEMCYHPKPSTRLFKEFEASGWKVISGIEAMIYQGLAQLELWTGTTLPESSIRETIEYVYKIIEKE